MYIDYTLDITELPQECIDDCSASGAVDNAIESWTVKLPFTVNRERAIACLEEYGAWTRAELTADSDEDIAGRILWIACGNFHEQQVWEERNPDKSPEDADYGSSVFRLE
jgi:hypothetical protein